MVRRRGFPGVSREIGAMARIRAIAAACMISDNSLALMPWTIGKYTATGGAIVTSDRPALPSSNG
jgi:hypothetical protein